MTPRELQERLEGHQWREQREMEKLAWLAANLINGLGRPKNPVEPSDLLPKKVERKTKQQVERERRELLRQFGEV